MKTEDLIDIDVEELNKKELEHFSKECCRFLVSENNKYYTTKNFEIHRTYEDVGFDKDFPSMKETVFRIKFKDKLDKFEEAKLLQKAVEKEYLDSPVTRREYNELLNRLSK